MPKTSAPKMSSDYQAIRKNPAGRPTSEELERRKAVIVAEATRQFVVRGYAGTNLVDIGRAAGVSTRTLYQHFGDKEGIFREVMFSQRSEYVVPPAQEDETLLNSMMRIAHYCFEKAFAPHIVEMLRLAIAEGQRFPDMMGFLIETGQGRFRKSVEMAFDQLVSDGLIKDGDTATSASFFLHLIVGDTVLMTLAGGPMGPSDMDWIKPKVELFIRGRWAVELS